MNRAKGIACTAGAQCVPAGNPCQSGAVSCSTGTPVCGGLTNVANGTACGASLVCNNGSCVSG